MAWFIVSCCFATEYRASAGHSLNQLMVQPWPVSIAGLRFCFPSHPELGVTSARPGSHRSPRNLQPCRKGLCSCLWRDEKSEAQAYAAACLTSLKPLASCSWGFTRGHCARDLCGEGFLQGWRTGWGRQTLGAMAHTQAPHTWHSACLSRRVEPLRSG